ncbi:mitofilin family membrane protein [Flexibacterium corallicola]|uniref:mitofilin family membrane protein n=1 Tax=Flexibacterium corallicola TaxID=3037259 RepID=UPI00286ED30D|nr:mitofilin family membrane protein [Pseudovibrio sp. M1P-2-3]
MATGKNTPGSSGGKGSSGHSRSRPSGRSAPSKDVTIDLTAKDVSESKKPDATSQAQKGGAEKKTGSPAGAKPAPTSGKTTPQSAGLKPKPAPDEAKKTVTEQQKTTVQTEKAKSPVSGAVKPAGKETEGSADKKTEASQKLAVDQAEKKSSTGVTPKTDTSSKPTKAAGPNAEGKQTSGKEPPNGGGGSGSTTAGSGEPKGHGALSLILAGLIGGAVVVGGGYGLHKAGLIDFSSVQSTASPVLSKYIEAAEVRFAALEDTLLKGNVPALEPSLSPQEIDAIASRLTKVETTQSEQAAAVSPPLSKEIQAQVNDLASGFQKLRSEVAEGYQGENSQAATLSASIASLKDKVTTLEQNSASAQTGFSAEEQAQISALEKKLDTLESTLSAQVEAFNTSSANLQSDLAKLMKAMGLQETSQTQLQSEISSLLKNFQETAQASSARLDKLESEIKRVGVQENAARLVAATSLKMAIDSGNPYLNELATMQTFYPGNSQQIQELEAYAKTGIPTKAQLISSFGNVARKMSAQEQSKSSEGTLDHLLSGAKSLISIRKVGESGGNDPLGLLGKMEARVETGDLNGAMRAYEQLPESMKLAGKQWAGEVSARLTVDQISDTINNEVLQSIVKSSANNSAKGAGE